MDIGDSEDEYIDDLRIRVDWYDERIGYWFIKLVGYCTGLLCHGLILDFMVIVLGLLVYQLLSYLSTNGWDIDQF